MKTKAKIGMMVLILALLAGLAPRAGAALYQMPITFGGYTNRSEALTNFPVLVVFSNGIGQSGFSYSNYPFVTTNGYDLRFYTNSADTGDGLDYEIESWNTNAASYVWVRVPLIPTNGMGSICAKWGGAASNQLVCTTNGAVWTNGFAGVWHLRESGNGTSGEYKDSTPNGRHAQGGGGTATKTPVSTTSGMVGTGQSFDGVDDYIETGWSLPTTNFTLSLWGKSSSSGFGNRAMGNADSTGGTSGADIIWGSSANTLYSVIRNAGANYDTSAAVQNLTTGWHHVLLALSGSGAILYYDGVAVKTNTSGTKITSSLTTRFGRDGNGTDKFSGQEDEIRISTLARSASWVWAEYLNVASNAAFNTYGAVKEMSSPRIENRTASGVTTNGATFNGTLADNGSSTATVYVAWGQTNGSVSGSWATTNWWNPGDWTNGSYPSTNMTLSPNANYYYTFGATNSSTNAAATNVQYLITGEVTVQATDPLGRATLSDPAAFTVYRPAACTNEALTVAYTLGGTATNGTHYTNSPAATGTNGTVTIPAGQTNAVITVCPLSLPAPEQTVVLTLVSSNYAIGSANSATGTLASRAAVTASGGTVTNYTENDKNFTAHIFNTVGTTSLCVNAGGDIEVLVVAGGGGGGGRYYAGGGGAGGLIYSNAYTVVADSNYTVTVGMSGAGGSGDNVRGSNGSNSVFGAIEATGGGGGGSYGTNPSGQNGGSGGGASGYSTTAYGTNLPAGQGNRGGVGGTYGAGGGGGAGSIGLNGSAANGGAGGTGVVYSISGATNYYAGGGGGGAYGGSGGPGGLGGGGQGASSGGVATNAVANTGGGGGGACGSNPGGNGGSGIVIVRYFSVPGAPRIENRAPSGVTTNGATFNGYLVTNGADNAAVFVAWGQTNGLVSGAWATTNWWNPGDWTNGSYPSTNLTLATNANYYYTFGATNSTMPVLAGGYRYLITGEVTVQATDPTGRVTQADTAAFTVYRPVSCTNEDLTVNYTLSGTATNGTHYTNSPAATVTNGTVTISKGQTSAVVTVYPLPLVVPPQTVVLNLASGSYAVGAANSATCTLARLPYTWKTASGNWNTAANWNPSGTPGAGDVAVITNNSPCLANTDLTGNPEIQVYTNCILDVTAGLTNQTIVLDNGGSLRKEGGTSATRTVADPIKIQGAGFAVGRSRQVDFNLNGPIQDGTSAGKLIVQWEADNYYQNAIYLRYTNNTYSGGTEVQAGRLSWPGGSMSYADKFYAMAPGSLGTGSVLVRSNAWLNLAATNTTGPGAVITVENGGKVEIGTNTAGHTILLKDGGKVCKDWVSANRTSADTIKIEGNGYAIAVWNQVSLSLNGMIQDGATPGRLVLDTEPNANNWGTVLYLNGTNTCTGGTEVRPTRAFGGWTDWIYAGAAGCFGSGPIVVCPDGWLNLLLPTAADWTLTNSISMGAKTSSITNTANIKVQAGAHRLTAAGNVVTAGAFTNAASVTTNTTGILAINTGKFAFGKTNGTYATLAIGIAGAGAVAGVDYSQLSVSSGDATLAASITNCDLTVTFATNLLVLSTSATNLVASGANFSSYQFHSVTWSGDWTGSVQYANGFIALTGMVRTLGAITLGPLGNVTTNSAQASALLTGMSADMYMFWDTQDREQNFTWAYTNTPLNAFTNTQPLTTITNTATGLAPGTQYTYRFYGFNPGLGWPVWSAAGTFTTPAQAAEVSVFASDPLGRTNRTDTAAFTVYRPLSATNYAVTVNYTLGGTATNGVDYTNAPAASGTNGTVMIAAGQTSAVVTVYPALQIVTQQTVVLTVAPGDYAIGSANSATGTLAAMDTTIFTWQTPNGNWDVAGNWSPSGPPGVISIGRITNNSPCLANTNLPGNPEIQVYTNCALDVAADLSSQTIVLDNGGSLRKDAYAGGTRTVSDPIKIQGAGYVVGRDQEKDFNLNGLIQDGASAGKLIAQWAADSKWAQPIYLRYTNNTYSGGTEVQAGRLSWPGGSMSYADKFYAMAPGSLGTGSVLVRSNAWLNLAATNTTGPGAVITVENGGRVEIGTNTAGHTILLKDGGKVCKDWVSANRTSADTIRIEGNGYAVAVINQVSLSLNGMIQDGATPGRLVLDTEPNANNWGTVLYLNGTNTCTGGTEVRPTRHTQAGIGWADWVFAGSAGCFGSGPLVVHPYAYLNLLLPTAEDWTLINSISMGAKVAAVTNTANIKVQDGTYRLTAAGNVVTVGAFTNEASLTTNTTGILAIDGKFAFAQTNGNYATLVIGIADVNGVAGIDYSRLSVGSGDTNLAASITNCDLTVTVATNLMVISTAATNLVAAGANFSSYQFHSVTWSGDWTGSVQYANGFIALTGMVRTLGAITLGPLGNVTTNSAQASALLTGMSADMYMFWDTQDRGQNFTWAYTNTPLTAFTNTQPLTTITNTATGLAPGTQYTYRFYGTNAALGWPLWSAAGTFTTPAQAAEVSVFASDPLGRTNRTDTAAFTVYRPLSATNYAVTVNYTLGGTATNGVDYTNAPAASGTNGMVMIAAGQTSAVVTVYPALQIVTQQTVVLTVASGDYAIGSANSATGTLAAMDTTIFTWLTANGNWNTATNWNPSGPPGVISIGRITNNSPCLANANLTGNPEIQVYTNCALDVATDLSSQTIVLDNGGSLRKDAYLGGTRTVSDPIKIQGTGYVVGRDQQVDFSLNGPIQDGTSAGKLVVQWLADGKWKDGIYLRSTNNSYSGGTEVQAGRLSWPGNDIGWADRLYAMAPGSLGTSNVLVRSNGWLNLSATNTTGPGVVITVENGGRVEIGTNTAGHTILLKDGGKVSKDNVSGANRTVTDTIRIEGNGYVIAVPAQTTLNLNGLIQDGATPGRLVLDSEPYAQNWGDYIYLNAANSHSGGTEVRPTRHTQPSMGWADWVYACNTGCFGSGPLVVHPNAWLNLLLGTAADWTLTNNIAMGTKTAPGSNGDWTMANIKVQDGTYRLTAAGSVVTVGAFTNEASLTTNTTGILAINGKFAFARTNGNYATLAIGIAGTNGVAGIDYSQLSVSSGDATLAASITNCDLSVTISAPGVADTMVFTNLVAAGADFSTNTFHNVVWSSGLIGTVQYGNGFILLKDIRASAEGSVFRFR